MPTIAELRASYNLPASANGQAVVNQAIRQTPGGAQMLQALTRIHEMQHGRARPDPVLQDVLTLLRQARDAMAEAILAGK